MRFGIPLFFIAAALFLGASQAQAQSCSTFAVIESYDADAGTATVAFEKGKMKKYFPKPEGTPADSMKVAKKCRKSALKEKTLKITPKGGRMTVTQFRSNFEGKMLNDTEDETWVGKHLEELVAAKTPVVIVLRRGLGKDAPMGITTIYMPITDEELAEIKRIEDQAADA